MGAAAMYLGPADVFGKSYQAGQVVSLPLETGLHVRHGLLNLPQVGAGDMDSNLFGALKSVNRDVLMDGENSVKGTRNMEVTTLTFDGYETNTIEIAQILRQDGKLELHTSTDKITINQSDQKTITGIRVSGEQIAKFRSLPVATNDTKELQPSGDKTFILCIDGKATVNGTTISSNQNLGLSDCSNIHIEASDKTNLLVVEVG